MSLSNFDIFNKQTLIDMLGDPDTATLIEIFGIFLSHTTRSWQRLNLHAKQQDWRQVNSIAHSLESSCQNTGAMALGRAMAELEKQTSGSNPATTVDLDINKVFELTIEHVRLHLRDIRTQIKP